MTTIQIDKGPAAENDHRSLDEKLTALNEIFSSLEGTVLIGYSGGVDSAMLAVAAHRVLGDRVIAVTADSESYAEGELEKATEAGQQDSLLLPLDTGLEAWPVVELSGEDQVRFTHGNPAPAQDTRPGNVRVYAPSG